MIRRASEQDMAAIVEMYNYYVENTTVIYQYVTQTLEERIQWYRNKIEHNEPVIVYEENGQVMGFATYGPFRPHAAYQYTIEHSVYVDKDHGGKGIGTILLQEIIRLAEENQYATMVGGIDSTNASSIALHKKCNFEYCGTIKRAGFKFDQYLDLDFYQLQLGGAMKN